MVVYSLHQNNTNQKVKDMKTSRVYSAWVKGTPTHVRAYNKKNAVKYYRTMDDSIRLKDVSFLYDHSGGPGLVEEIYPELFQ